MLKYFLNMQVFIIVLKGHKYIAKVIIIGVFVQMTILFLRAISSKQHKDLRRSRVF